MESYNRLIEDFCASAGIDDVGDVLHRGLLDVDGVPIRVEYAESTDQCVVLADLGDVPLEHRFDLYELMLESNFENDEYGTPVLSMHPDGNRGVLTMHFSVHQLLADGGLNRAVRDHVLPLVQAWTTAINAGDFLSEEDEPVLSLAV